MLPDTQQLQARRPIPGRQGQFRRRRLRWLLLAIVGVTSCTLTITIALMIAVLSSGAMGETGSQLRVNFNDGGSLSQHRTRARSVGELLDDIAIEIPSDAALSHELSAELVDDMTIAIIPAREVTITLQDSEMVLRTPLDNALDILESADINVSAEDKIWVNGALARFEALPDWTIPARHIEIRRPVRLTISIDGEATSVLTTANTVGAALAEAGIALQGGDKLDPAADTAIDGDITLTIKRGIPVSLKVDGVVIEARSSAKRVDELLEELEVSLYDQDYVIPAGASAISQDMLIEIVRVTDEVVSQSEIISFETRYVADAQLSLDQTSIVQLGKEGAREIRSRVRYENGVEVSREVIETEITEAPQDQVIHYGTKFALGTVNTPQGPRQYWRVLCMYATSYHPAALGGDDRTSIGETLRKGIVAADPDIIPYRTEVFVSEYGTGMMADTAGWRSSPYWIDLGYSDDDWKSWGGYVKVFLLGAPSEAANSLLPDWTPIRSRPASNCVN